MNDVAAAAAPPLQLRVVRWVGFRTIVIREYGRIIRIWGQTIVPSVVTAVLYFAIFGSLIGRRVGGAAAAATSFTASPAPKSARRQPAPAHRARRRRPRRAPRPGA